MARERQVKVIKRVERERLEQEAAEKVVPRQTPREAARALVATVTEWIEVSRQERRDKLTVF
jgi:hypothetical protein